MQCAVRSEKYATQWEVWDRELWGVEEGGGRRRIDWLTWLSTAWGAQRETLDRNAYDDDGGGDGGDNVDGGGGGSDGH